MTQNFNKTKKTRLCFFILAVLLMWFPAKIKAQEAQGVYPNGDYYGQTIINAPGGTNADNGIQISLSGAGNMQILRNNTYQIFNPGIRISNGTTKPYDVPGTKHGLVLAIGTTYFTSGTLSPSGAGLSGGNFNIISSTQQSLIESPPGHFEDVIRLSAVKNGMTYYLDVKYTYNFPDSRFLIDYTVTIPPGNTEKVTLAHGWDTFLSGGDNGPGFVTGTAPYYVMGVAKTPSYEAFQYLGGVPWSGYFSALYSDLGTNLANNTFMAFNNTINPSSYTDNGIGISMDFGKTPGTYTSNNAIVMDCEAGDIPPVLSTATVKQCTGTTFNINLNSYITSATPSGATIVWKNAFGSPVADPTNVTATGTYTATYYSSRFACTSPGAVLTISYDSTCAVCYKPAVTSGTKEPIKTIISTLDRVSVPRNMSDPRAGSLILESKTRGFVITRIASPETAIVSPVEGMIVYDTTANVIKLYNGTVWHALAQTCPD
ncbi:hypothetical protein [Flavobacterium sp. Root186]|uniref:hypothetical protein n=1 Tax=Flavobacterium sp. Root186 TaxID=1736485 RepID=UPI0006FCCB44|nr:hypothetical protein [Flavobacterium sp. Root186]KRB56373.1 hypothetical protein ASD98_10960 [Flavobacterium sp. Root186]